MAKKRGSNKHKARNGKAKDACGCNRRISKMSNDELSSILSDDNQKLKHPAAQKKLDDRKKNKKVKKPVVCGVRRGKN